MNQQASAIEQAVAAAGVECIIEFAGGALVITGTARTGAEKDGVLDIAREMAPDTPIVDNIDIGSVLPEHLPDMALSEAGDAGFPTAEPFTSDDEALEPGDFTDQAILNDQDGAAGPGGTTDDEDIGEGEEVYVPPTDPVSTREGDFLGGFQTTSMDPEIDNRGVLPGIADEAMAEEVRRELREDAATNPLEIEVSVRDGVVYLRGLVNDIEDAENAEAVATRIDGVRQVEDKLELRVG